MRLWDLETGQQCGCYFADAAFTAVAVGLGETRAFAGDALGRIHVIRLSEADAE